ncbi:MAG: hypothetical protein C0478_10625 [Planctomyces sp.]|jgi:hypothetical protein|nr:hypothetical protein [Planctomyces sp.]
MMRAAFFGLGTFVALTGYSFLVVDKFVMTGEHEERAKGFRGMLTSPETIHQHTKDVFDPPEWCAFVLMSVGCVTMLYSAALPKHGH